jgi:RND family efflux transporter MFP subunit
VKNRFNLILIALLWAGISLLLAGCSRATQAKNTPGAKSKTVQVKTAHVKRQEIERRVETVGTLMAEQEVVVSAEVEGRVTEVLADLGDRVQKGQALVNILPEEMQYSLQQQEAQLRQVLDRLGLKNENDKVTDINKVPEVAKARADLQEAEQRYARVKELVAQNIASRQDLDQAEARDAALRASVELARRQAETLVAQVSQYKATVELARKKLRDTSVRAPFAGAIRERQVQVGQYVRPQTPLFELVNVDPLRLRAEVPEKMSSWVREGNQVEVRVEAHPDRVFTGRVTRISPAVDQEKRTFLVEAVIPNREGVLRPGFYTKAAIITNRKEYVLLIPASAILYAYGTNKAFVVNGGKTSARELRLGERLGETVEVVEGLKADEQIAITELDRLDNGTLVQILDQ